MAALIRASKVAPSGLRMLGVVVVQKRNTSNKVRPISPDVTIYKFPLTALTSITNRATAVGISAGVSAAALVALSGNCEIGTLIMDFKEGYPILAGVTKTVVCFPLAFHTVAGLRHLFWDATAKGLTNEEVDRSSQVVIGAAVVLTGALALYSF